MSSPQTDREKLQISHKETLDLVRKLLLHGSRTHGVQERTAVILDCLASTVSTIHDETLVGNSFLGNGLHRQQTSQDVSSRLLDLAEAADRRQELDRQQRAEDIGDIVSQAKELGYAEEDQIFVERLLREAWGQGNVETSCLLEKEDANKDEVTSEESETALFQALQKGEDEVLDVLKQEHVPDLNAMDSAGFTALHRAATSGFFAACVELLQRQDFQLSDARNSFGFTALHCAASSGVPWTCLVLLDDARFRAVSVPNIDGCTALHLAAHHGHIEVCEALLGHPRFTSIASLDSSGRTALHRAALAGHAEVCQVLLEHCRFDAAACRDAAGRSALHHAAERGFPKVCSVLLALCSDVLEPDARDTAGFTALDLCPEGTEVWQVVFNGYMKLLSERTRRARDPHVLGGNLLPTAASHANLLPRQGPLASEEAWRSRGCSASDAPADAWNAAKEWRWRPSNLVREHHKLFGGAGDGTWQQLGDGLQQP